MKRGVYGSRQRRFPCLRNCPVYWAESLLHFLDSLAQFPNVLVDRCLIRRRLGLAWARVIVRRAPQCTLGISSGTAGGGHAKRRSLGGGGAAAAFGRRGFRPLVCFPGGGRRAGVESSRDRRSE